MPRPTPPPPPAFNPTQPAPPRAIVEPPADPIPALVAELATRHDGDVSLSFATTDAQAAFKHSGSTDAVAWCETVRQAHARYLSDRRSGRKPKPLGYWFADGVMLKYTEMPKQPDTPVIECTKCQGAGTVLPKDYALPVGCWDDPDFDPDAFMDSQLIKCPKCHGSGKRVRALEAVSAAANGTWRFVRDEPEIPYVKRGEWS